MLLLILVPILAFLFWLWWKRETNENEPPEYVFHLEWRKLHNVVSDGERLWRRAKKMSAECLKRDGTMKMTIGPRTVYVITDPDDFLTVSNACLEKDPFYNFCKNWLGNGLISAPTSKWKVHRKLLNPLFSQRAVDSLMEVFNNISRQLVENLEVEVGKGPFDHYPYTRRNALDTICMTALGAKFMENTEVRNKYIHLTETLMKIYISRLKNFFYHYDFTYNFSSLKREEDKCTDTVRTITNAILNQIKEGSKNEDKCSSTEKNQSQGLKFKPFIRVLLEMFSNSDAFTDSDIRQHVDTFVVAGEDTTAGVSMYCMLLVGSYSQVQDKIYEEINEIFGDDERDVTKEDLSRLVYLEAVLKETMRFYPIVPIIGRHLDKDVKLRNCTLSKGRTAILSIYGIHRHPMWGPDADEFRPERWLSPLSNIQKMFAGFSMGRRICIGKTYAMASLKVILVHVFRNYIIHSDHTKCTFDLDITLKPTSGHHITIERRNKNKPSAES
ncbi:cytochrome P450 4V2-like [Danaus plexippus]|uniref:cytochrome P450 4V2-like n=1 Tax=Danaus plexippus TaxID=13037 RepID=UPI002AAF408A|nr:cytochrome P450 4V2-like [Danaus plexippus]XP_061380020.1 cytochrome P450 4V2-like [Danaus plexippus]